MPHLCRHNATTFGVAAIDLSSLGFCRAHHCAQDSRMRSAAAEIAGESLFDLLQSRMRRLVKDGPRGHDHPVGTIAALRGLLGDESGLDDIRLFRRSEAFESCDSAARGLFYRRDAGAH